MGTIAIELSDAGVLAAGGDPPRVLEVDQHTTESPGYAVQLKKQLLLGREALEQARLHPRQVNNRYWSQLSTNPLPDKTATVRNYAELAFAHLNCIRDNLPESADDWVFAVPGYLDETKLAILLGVANELSVPIKGLVSGAVAAIRCTTTRQPMIHIDVHLHCVEITRLQQGMQIVLEKTQVIPENGWHDLTELLAKSLTNEFVKSTRFDPLHVASTEQQLHNQLATILRKGPGGQGFPIELKTGRTAYSLSVLPQMLTAATSALRDKIKNSVQLLANQSVGDQCVASVQLSHRAAMVPGLRDDLQSLLDFDVEELPAGAGAMGALQLADSFANERASKGAALFTSRSRHPEEQNIAGPAASTSASHAPDDDPTHLLYKDRAYPIETQPLVIGTALTPEDTGVVISTQVGNVAARHCSVLRENGRPVLEVLASNETFVDGVPASGRIALVTGQCIRLGDPPQNLRPIFVVSSHGA